MIIIVPTSWDYNENKWACPCIKWKLVAAAAAITSPSICCALLPELGAAFQETTIYLLWISSLKMPTTVSAKQGFVIWIWCLLWDKSLKEPCIGDKDLWGVWRNLIKVKFVIKIENLNKGGGVDGLILCLAEHVWQVSSHALCHTWGLALTISCLDHHCSHSNKAFISSWSCLFLAFPTWLHSSPSQAQICPCLFLLKLWTHGLPVPVVAYGSFSYSHTSPRSQISLDLPTVYTTVYLMVVFKGFK